MCMGKPPKPVPPASFQDARNPEQDASVRTADRAARRRGYGAAILTGPMGVLTPATTTSSGSGSTVLGA